jgi:hypothetical protein
LNSSVIKPKRRKQKTGESENPNGNGDEKVQVTVWQEKIDAESQTLLESTVEVFFKSYFMTELSDRRNSYVILIWTQGKSR